MISVHLKDFGTNSGVLSPQGELGSGDMQTSSRVMLSKAIL
jgi:hypothetical protein